MVAPEVVRLKKQEDAAAGLVADELRLLRRRRAREEQRRSGRAGRRDDDPAFVLGRLISVFDDGEAKLLCIERNRLVIVGDDERDVRDTLLHAR
jgi:hypothetical protein